MARKSRGSKTASASKVSSGKQDALAKAVEKDVHKHAQEKLPEGAYFDREGRAALVFAAGPARVEAILIVDGVVDMQVFRPSVFTRRFGGRWPAYPLRRGARIFLNSELAKTDAALRRLRLMVTQ